MNMTASDIVLEYVAARTGRPKYEMFCFGWRAMRSQRKRLKLLDAASDALHVVGRTKLMFCDVFCNFNSVFCGLVFDDFVLAIRLTLKEEFNAQKNWWQSAVIEYEFCCLKGLLFCIIFEVVCSFEKYVVEWLFYTNCVESALCIQTSTFAT